MGWNWVNGKGERQDDGARRAETAGTQLVSPASPSRWRIMYCSAVLGGGGGQGDPEGRIDLKFQAPRLASPAARDTRAGLGRSCDWGERGGLQEVGTQKREKALTYLTGPLAWTGPCCARCGLVSAKTLRTGEARKPAVPARRGNPRCPQ